MKSRKLAVASWSLSCFSKEGGSRGPECRYLIYQALTPPPPRVQLHPSPQYLLLLGLLLVAADMLGHEKSSVGEAGGDEEFGDVWWKYGSS